MNQVVEKFYRKVENDRLLKAPFTSVEDWPQHIERLTHFWWTRFGGNAYRPFSYDPVGKHFETGFSEYFLERWLELFSETLAECLPPPQASFWEEMAKSMGTALARNNDLMIQFHRKKSKA
jgi:hemoglobin